MQYLNKALTVDPGDHTGYAYWKGDLYPLTGQYNLISKFRNNILEDQLVYLNNNFSNLLEHFNPEIVYIEGVEFWEGSLKSLTAAKRQNLSKLSYLVGGYLNETARRGMSCRIIPARVWKGQMNNNILYKKVFTINSQVYPSEHVLNAVGIGLSRMGYFQNTRTRPKKFIKNKRIGHGYGIRY